jgi:hypothetical protein
LPAAQYTHSLPVAQYAHQPAYYHWFVVRNIQKLGYD